MFSRLGYGGNRSPESVEGNAEGARIPCKQAAEKTSPGALEREKGFHGMCLFQWKERHPYPSSQPIDSVKAMLEMIFFQWQIENPMVRTSDFSSEVDGVRKDPWPPAKQQRSLIYLYSIYPRLFNLQTQFLPMVPLQE